MSSSVVMTSTMRLSYSGLCDLQSGAGKCRTAGLFLTHPIKDQSPGVWADIHPGTDLDILGGMKCGIREVDKNVIPRVKFGFVQVLTC